MKIRTTLAVTIGLLALVALPTLPASASDANATTKDRRPVVTVVDHTGGVWPVKAVARAWSHPRLLRVIVRDGCRAGTYCVSVVAGNFDPGWMGNANPTGPASAIVYLNDLPELARFTSDPVVRSGIVCHELAHVFGIDHQPPSVGQWGCIANSDYAHTTALPTFRDVRLLRSSARDPFGAQWGAFRWFADAR